LCAYGFSDDSGWEKMLGGRWVLAAADSLIICGIGLRTAQLGFIPANLFVLCSLTSKPGERPESPDQRRETQNHTPGQGNQSRDRID
jgi:hypothetical protein